MNPKQKSYYFNGNFLLNIYMNIILVLYKKEKRKKNTIPILVNGFNQLMLLTQE